VIDIIGGPEGINDPHVRHVPIGELVVVPALVLGVVVYRPTDAKLDAGVVNRVDKDMVGQLVFGGIDFRKVQAALEAVGQPREQLFGRPFNDHERAAGGEHVGVDAELLGNIRSVTGGGDPEHGRGILVVGADHRVAPGDGGGAVGLLGLR